MDTTTTTFPPALHALLADFHAQVAGGLSAAEADFLARYPAYQQTRALDDLRCQDYARLDRLGHTYLDYTGGSLYGESQLQQHTALLASNVYGNPHSLNPTSRAATDINEQARAAVLRYFNADPQQYSVIFTLNASGALKLVGESYPFDHNSHYLLTFDNHNSVNGIREFARSRGAKITYVPLLPDSLRMDEAALLGHLQAADSGGHRLFAYPAQSNFSGAQHPLAWIETAQAHGWDVLLDAAAFVPTNALDLARWQPQFVSLSFYKMFGYPTGIGALIVRRDALGKLHRPWFAGGTISIASVQGDRHFLHENEAGYEDGTINYLGIPAVEIGLQQLQRADVARVHTRVALLTEYLLAEFAHLRHSSGAALVHLYGPASAEGRGGTLAFNLYDPQGRAWDYRVVEALANEVNISLRTGCFCNPGAGEAAHRLTAQRMQQCFANDRLTFETLASSLKGTGDADIVGAIRASLGIVSSFADVYRFASFLRLFRDQPVPQTGA